MSNRWVTRRPFLTGLIGISVLSFVWAGAVQPAYSDATPAVAVGPLPAGIAYVPDRGEVFVASQAGHKISVISSENYSRIASIDVELLPLEMVYDSGRGLLYVVHSYQGPVGLVSVISVANRSVIRLIEVGHLASGITYSPDRGEVFVANQADGTVSVISDSSNSVVATLDVGPSPHGLAYNPDANGLFVTHSHIDSPMSDSSAPASESNGDFVSFVKADTGEVIWKADRVANAWGVAYDSQRGVVFTTEHALGGVVVELSALSGEEVARVNVGAEPAGIAYIQGGDKIVVTNQEDDTISVISAADNSVVGTAKVGSHPRFAAYVEDSGSIFVSNTDDGTVSIVSLSSVGTETPSPPYYLIGIAVIGAIALGAMIWRVVLKTPRTEKASLIFLRREHPEGSQIS